MKRVFQHPPEPPTGKRYWRSLGELNDTPEFRQWLEREFPPAEAQAYAGARQSLGMKLVPPWLSTSAGCSSLIIRAVLEKNLVRLATSHSRPKPPGLIW